MRKLTKRTLAVLLSAIMAFPTILAMPFAAEAATKWTPIASSDFTKTSSVSSNASLGEVPTYNGKGSAMTWSNGVWTGNGDASKSEDGAIYIPDGYMYLTGYSGGSVPITGQSQWKIDFGFRFKTTAGADDAYYNSDEYSFLKMYVFKPVIALVNRTPIVKYRMLVSVIAYLVTFFVCGLWHGSTLNFVFWGLWHGIGLSIYKVATNKNVGKSNGSLSKIMGVAVTFVFVTVGWIFFNYPVEQLVEMFNLLF